MFLKPNLFIKIKNNKIQNKSSKWKNTMNCKKIGNQISRFTLKIYNFFLQSIGYRGLMASIHQSYSQRRYYAKSSYLVGRIALFFVKSNLHPWRIVLQLLDFKITSWFSVQRNPPLQPEQLKWLWLEISYFSTFSHIFSPVSICLSSQKVRNTEPFFIEWFFVYYFLSVCLCIFSPIFLYL